MKEFHIQWHITDKCNLRCVHCYQEKFSEEGELTSRELQLVCENLFPTMKMWGRNLTISITGGEPFLKDEVFDLLETLNDSEFVGNLSIITNGTLLGKFIPAISRIPKLRTLFISLDGTSPDGNDSIRGKGTWETVIRNIKTLKSKGWHEIFLMFTILRRNLIEAKNLLPLARHLGVSGFIIERFVPLGRGKKISDEVLSGDELSAFFRDIFYQLEAEYDVREVGRHRAFKVCLDTSGNPTLYGAECIAGRDGMAILPDGTVLPCRRFCNPVGNLLKTPLYEIWQNSMVLENICKKENLKGKCSTCRIADCFGCRAITHTLTGDYLGEDPACLLSSEVPQLPLEVSPQQF